ncbi:hypothetical protein NDU88_000462 [Pleurodeles waltl]|uniref:Uncharacterized protein n=1 Tax=Pleurodeles waltl TaxID=8319 RepID=A0AAV7SX55_PLEWA|nr:hypothetical protein NDU88_000462 [Pleurodeles waltl]
MECELDYEDDEEELEEGEIPHWKEVCEGSKKRSGGEGHANVSRSRVIPQEGLRKGTSVWWVLAVSARHGREHTGATHQKRRLQSGEAHWWKGWDFGHGPRTTSVDAGVVTSKVDKGVGTEPEEGEKEGCSNKIGDDDATKGGKKCAKAVRAWAEFLGSGARFRPHCAKALEMQYNHVTQNIMSNIDNRVSDATIAGKLAGISFKDN